MSWLDSAVQVPPSRQPAGCPSGKLAIVVAAEVDVHQLAEYSSLGHGLETAMLAIKQEPRHAGHAVRAA